MTMDAAAPQVPAKQKSSCWLVGGVTCLVVAIIAVILVIIAAWAFQRWYGQALEQWTDAEPAELPATELSPQQAEQVVDRVRAFNEALRAGEDAEPLRLSDAEINALIQHHPDLEALRGVVHVTIENDQVKGELSMPLDWFPGAAGRYLNGSAVFDVFMRNDALFVTLQDLEVRGQQAPPEFMEPLSRENLAQDVYQDPNLGPLLRQIGSVAIENNELVIDPKPAAERSGGGTAPAEAPAQAGAESV